jgi:hypothetical protein
MDGNEVQGTRGRDRARKRAGRRARGLAVTERDGIWHVSGTIRAGGRSIRLRRSLGLPATAENYDAAWDEVRAIEKDLRAEVSGDTPRGDPVALAAKAYLTSPRERPLGASAIRIIKEVVAKFGPRRGNDIPASEWKEWVDRRHAGNKAQTREKFLNIVTAFLAFAVKHHKFAAIIEFERDNKARNPSRRARRKVDDLRPELIKLLFDCSHISIRAQLATEWSTGSRVSSVLYGVRICDVNLARGRETILFRDTKNGDDVLAALHPSAADVLREYAEWRGNLYDREAPFFLTYKKRPYVDNGRDGGGQNKTGFNAAKRRARLIVLDIAFSEARELRRKKARAAALDVLLQARSDARLLRKVTQHWFRHMLATRMRHDLKAAMEQGGWRDLKSVMGYIHDVPAARRAAVESFDDFASEQTAKSRVKSVPK